LQRAPQYRDLLGVYPPRGKFLEGAERNPVGLTEGPVDGARFGHPHLGVVEDQGRDVAGMGVAITDKAAALRRLVHSRFEDPEVLLGSAQTDNGFRQDAVAVLPLRQAEQVSMGHELSHAWERARSRPLAVAFPFPQAHGTVRYLSHGVLHMLTY